MRHLTWSGRREVVWYALRRWFVAPAPEHARCWMGGPIGPHVHCPRYALPGSYLCARHARETAGGCA